VAFFVFELTHAFLSLLASRVSMDE
jgi:hypothetical protein